MHATFKGGTKMKGGVTPPTPAPPLVSGNPKVAKSARKTYADGGVVDGKKSMMRLDRPGRKSGGRVGADCAPLVGSASTTGREGGK